MRVVERQPSSFLISLPPQALSNNATWFKMLCPWRMHLGLEGGHYSLYTDKFWSRFNPHCSKIFLGVICSFFSSAKVCQMLPSSRKRLTRRSVMRTVKHIWDKGFSFGQLSWFWSQERRRETVSTRTFLICALNLYKGHILHKRIPLFPIQIHSFYAKHQHSLLSLSCSSEMKIHFYHLCAFVFIFTFDILIIE